MTLPITVTDAAGLNDTATMTITVIQPSGGNPGNGNIPCSTGGGKAGDTGHKVWCWQDVTVTETQNKDSNVF